MPAADDRHDFADNLETRNDRVSSFPVRSPCLLLEAACGGTQRRQSSRCRNTESRYSREALLLVPDDEAKKWMAEAFRVPMERGRLRLRQHVEAELEVPLVHEAVHGPRASLDRQPERRPDVESRNSGPRSRGPSRPAGRRPRPGPGRRPKRSRTASVGWSTRGRAKADSAATTSMLSDTSARRTAGMRVLRPRSASGGSVAPNRTAMLCDNDGRVDEQNGDRLDGAGAPSDRERRSMRRPMTRWMTAGFLLLLASAGWADGPTPAAPPPSVPVSAERFFPSS